MVQQYAHANNSRNPLVSLNNKWTNTYQRLNHNIDTLDSWEIKASLNSLMLYNFESKIDSLSRANFMGLINSNSHKFKPLSKESFAKRIAQQIQRTQADNQIVFYYISESAGQMLWMPIITITLLFIWINFIRRKILIRQPSLMEPKFFKYLNKTWYAIPFLIVLNFLHLFNIYAPWTYLLLVQVLLALTCIFLLWKNHGRSISIPVIGMTICLICISFVGNMPPNSLQYTLILVLDVVQIALTWFMFKKFRQTQQVFILINTILGIATVLTILSLFLCLLHRNALAIMLTTGACIGIIQIIGLSLFKQSVSEILLLQLNESRLRFRVTRSMDGDIIAKDIFLAIFLIMLYSWGSMFAYNLNIYQTIGHLFGRLFFQPITIGSISFSLSGVILFFIIIWLANFLQRFLGYIFLDTDDNEENDEIFKKQRSRMLTTKIIVLAIGYLLAISASGMPLDKITIIIGALGVGVGMGLQNIVNNFISGIILIFDKPLQLGDTIEVKGNSGKVSDIGIRTSTLLVEDGAEVIIPNGDILSNSIVNWTHSNNNKRINLDFKIATQKDDSFIRELIYSSVQHSTYISKGKPIDILFNSIKSSEMDIKVFIWIRSIHKTALIQSELRLILCKAFDQNEVEIL